MYCRAFGKEQSRPAETSSWENYLLSVQWGWLILISLWAPFASRLWHGEIAPIYVVLHSSVDGGQFISLDIYRPFCARLYRYVCRSVLVHVDAICPVPLRHKNEIFALRYTSNHSITQREYEWLHNVAVFAWRHSYNSNRENVECDVRSLPNILQNGDFGFSMKGDLAHGNSQKQILLFEWWGLWYPTAERKLNSLTYSCIVCLMFNFSVANYWRRKQLQ